MHKLLPEALYTEVFSSLHKIKLFFFSASMNLSLSFLVLRTILRTSPLDVCYSIDRRRINPLYIIFPASFRLNHLTEELFHMEKVGYTFAFVKEQ